MNKLLLITLLSVGVIIAGCSQNEEETKTEDSGQSETTKSNESSDSPSNTSDFLQPFEGSTDHIHGVGYLQQENGIAFASHTGLKFYKDGKWMETTGQNNDYMGFTAVDEGFYTSGHPGKDSDLPNPLGLKKSTDGGRSLENLGFEGESDFHTIGVGYENHAIYLLNMQPNSELDAGFYRSFDDGTSWDAVEAEGLNNSPFAIAVHPTDENIVAVSNETGVYLSEDAGKTFEPVKENVQGTAVYFEGDRLYYATYDGESNLAIMNLENRSSETVELPELTNQAILYLAKNPANEAEITLLASDGEKEAAYITKDNGENWQQIIKQGTAVAE
ncbi:F510_1955 family glycosylhydrolase [Thalassobacillus devorans]|jgi:hypothetical protein|uniref:F510_1955 family glycosylhydrolase n=1 Tax=Thalassobacillus devorans TaxID=279813 RepID=UPI00048B5129|nr:hypothetical protein [Thalassobacillus devorans]